MWASLVLYRVALKYTKKNLNTLKIHLILFWFILVVVPAMSRAFNAPLICMFSDAA
jgi:hypothetical protein